MPDDLDNLIRAAMKSLDEQVPSGYFEALPNQTLARLEGSSMQHGSSGTTQNRDAAVAPPPVTAMDAAADKTDQNEREEDSGLHDIRNLAQSTKQRLSSKRDTRNPPISDDDVLAASSGSWKNIALPQPARMVSLPELAELPTKHEVVAAEKSAKKSKKEKALAVHDMAVADAALAVEAPILETRQAFTLPSQQRKTSKGPIVAIVGMGLAAAAGGLIFMQVNKTEDTSTAASEPEAVQAAAPAATVTPIATGSAAPEPTPPPAEEAKAADAPAVAAELATDDEEQAEAPKKSAGKGGKAKKPEKEVHKVEIKSDPKLEKAPEVKPVEVKKPAGGAKEAEPDQSFDSLLKEAGVEGKKDVKPKLDKKSLSGDDFKKGMGAIAGKAKGCYKGTQGTASVKLTVGPTGQVTKVSVGGEFAGKPEGACIESAVKAASFPPWDGGPQSFSYSYMLSD